MVEIVVVQLVYHQHMIVTQPSSWGACSSECLDPDANDDCCDDNNCPFTCEGQELITCWDGSCSENITECPDETCYDTPCSSYLNTNTCPEIEEQYDYDCSICLYEGLCPLTCEDEGLLTCVTTGQCVEDLVNATHAKIQIKL